MTMTRFVSFKVGPNQIVLNLDHIVMARATKDGKGTILTLSPTDPSTEGAIELTWDNVSFQAVTKVLVSNK